MAIASLALNSMLAMAAFICTLLRNSASTSAFAVSNPQPLCHAFRYYSFLDTHLARPCAIHRRRANYAHELVLCVVHVSREEDTNKDSLFFLFLNSLTHSLTHFSRASQFPPQADCALDAVSSVIVFWRYYGSKHNLYMHAREQVACIYLGVLFVISGAAVIGKATADIITQSLPSSVRSPPPLRARISPVRHHSRISAHISISRRECVSLHWRLVLSQLLVLHGRAFLKAPLGREDAKRDAHTSCIELDCVDLLLGML